jgi:dTDP-4-dehydrorhamnose reductase
MKTVRVVLFGAGGQTGCALRRLAPSDWDWTCPSRREIDLAADCDRLTLFLGHVRPDVIINASAYNAVEEAEKHPEEAHAINARAVDFLAEWSVRRSVHLVHFSTDYVFAGLGSEPISPAEKPAPQNVYGASKAAGERAFLADEPGRCLIRTSAVFGTRSRSEVPHNFVEKILARARLGQPFAVREDLCFAPTWTDDLARFAIACVTRRTPGIHHCTSEGETTWFGWARDIVRRAGLSETLVQPTAGTPPGQAVRPRYTVLQVTHPPDAPPRTPWQTALQNYLSHA